MSWADIVADRKPTMAPSTSTGRSPTVGPAVASMRQATHPLSVSNITGGLASMSIAGSSSSQARTPVVKENLLGSQFITKQSKNRRHQEGNKKTNESANRKVVIVKSHSTGVPLKKFHLFPKLPAELRFKIYRHAMTQRRLIELEWGPNMDITIGTNNGSHQSVRVCPRSRIPPALMHVCHESREEAKNVYTLRCFDCKIARYSNSPELHEHYIWYNQNADINFFGEDTCLSTYIRSFSGEEYDIPAIAIVNSSKGESCCSHDNQTYGVNGGVDTLQALHGFDPSVTTHDFRYGGCPGLKEVFIVVKSKLWLHKQGEIDQSVTLRTATNEGLTTGQIRYKFLLERKLALVAVEQVMPRVGKNVWTGKNKPKFQFVSFAPVARGVDPGEPDGMTISRKDLGKLRRSDWAFVKRTEAVTGCEIFIPEEEYRGEDPREIGFWGVRKNIDAAKKAIEERLTSANAEK